jgi:hypothetical protein
MAYGPLNRVRVVAASALLATAIQVVAEPRGPQFPVAQVVPQPAFEDQAVSLIITPLPACYRTREILSVTRVDNNVLVHYAFTEFPVCSIPPPDSLVVDLGTFSAGSYAVTASGTIDGAPLPVRVVPFTVLPSYFSVPTLTPNGRAALLLGLTLMVACLRRRKPPPRYCS